MIEIKYILNTFSYFVGSNKYWLFVFIEMQSRIEPIFFRYIQPFQWVQQLHLMLNTE